jgi:hypothetical protein
MALGRLYWHSALPQAKTTFLLGVALGQYNLPWALEGDNLMVFYLNASKIWSDKRGTTVPYQENS